VSESFEVHIAKAEHVFSAAHFITFANRCERLHGHNYHVSAEIAGPLDENHLVTDFLMIRAKLLKIAAELDHYVLLPTQHPQIHVEKNDHEVTATFAERRWVFPVGDCRLLPVPNTTSELLAAYIGKKLFEALGGAAAKIERMNVSVDECDGQIGVWNWRANNR
jgi:6-pyruvoyltetrahydropterin/6-carboxytetrahydropterin synthase